MTATIVNAVTREPIAEEWRKLAYIDGDGTQRVFDPATYPRIGQLWERVAERNRPHYDVYPWKVLDAVEHFHSSAGRPVCIAGLGYKGSLGRHVCGDHHSHGIIRAGERIK